MSFVALKFKTLAVQVFGQPQLVTAGRGAGLKVGTLFGDVGGGEQVGGRHHQADHLQ